MFTSPTGIPCNTYSPSILDAVPSVLPLIETDAPGSVPPVLSFIVPRRFPLSCANIDTGINITTQKTNNFKVSLIKFKVLNF